MRNADQIRKEVLKDLTKLGWKVGESNIDNPMIKELVNKTIDLTIINVYKDLRKIRNKEIEDGRLEGYLAGIGVP